MPDQGAPSNPQDLRAWLVEHSVLAAHGLLDEEDQARFEALMETAPIPLRDQVLAEQERLMRSGSLDHVLMDGTPPPGLRERVLEAVRQAIRSETLFRSEGAMVVRRAAASGVPRGGAEQGAQDDRAEDERPLLRFGRVRRIHPVWRPIALGSLAASLAVAVVSFQIQGEIRKIQEQQGTIAFYDWLGAPYLRESLFSPELDRTILTAVNPEFTGQAAVHSDPAWDVANLYLHQMPQLPEGQRYAVVLMGDEGKPVLDAEGKPVELVERFSPSAVLMQFELQIPAEMTGRVAIYTADSNGLRDLVMTA